MGRIMSIDYGHVRSGIAVTDSLRITANALTTVITKNIFDFLDTYLSKEIIDILVVGYPRNLKYELADITKEIDIFISKFSEKYPNIKVELIDERFTSKMAFQTMIDSGIGKKARQNKALIDKISATIILENYLDWNK
ncbi:MAG: Holliday junction resolvase RuvX [Bacteroidales bacterium]|nr:Holliday junction resolvase RuvX [Bacteroidales bacterium]MDD5975906.1 Holliday junction resolvase RuvX [Bacteroidales bacterium]MDY5193761.1 Holliday junction resolvase RuvX [Candidatus Aphodosoma sp.]